MHETMRLTLDGMVRALGGPMPGEAAPLSVALRVTPLPLKGARKGAEVGQGDFAMAAICGYAHEWRGAEVHPDRREEEADHVSAGG